MKIYDNKSTQSLQLKQLNLQKKKTNLIDNELSHAKLGLKMMTLISSLVRIFKVKE